MVMSVILSDRKSGIMSIRLCEIRFMHVSAGPQLDNFFFSFKVSLYLSIYSSHNVTSHNSCNLVATNRNQCDDKLCISGKTNNIDHLEKL